MKRILHIVGKMDRGGQETLIMNLYRNIDRKKYQFDFVVNTPDKGDYDDEILLLGGKIYHISSISKSLIKHCKDLFLVIKNNDYKIVHRHTSSSIVFIDFFISFFAGASNRICHSHNTRNSDGFIHSLCKPLLNISCNKKLACGHDAGIFLYGKNQKFLVIPNGIDTNKFMYDSECRRKQREKLGISDKLVIGNIGRFNLQKNHERIIDIFNKFIMDGNKDAVLLLIGKGELEEEIKDKVKKLKLQKYVKFLGTRNDVNELLMAMDLLLFPSFFEGLPVVLVESQATGLPCVISDTITSEVKVFDDLILYESLDSDDSAWSAGIKKFLKAKHMKREKYSLKMQQSNYNIKNSIMLLEEVYDK